MLNPEDPEHCDAMAALIMDASTLMQWFKKHKFSPGHAMEIFCALFAVMYEAGDIGLPELGQMNNSILDMAKFIKARREIANKQKE